MIDLAPGACFIPNIYLISPGCPTPSIGLQYVIVGKNTIIHSFIYSFIHGILPCVAGHVIVYGQSLDAYCCVNTLISMGISGNRIDIVMPPANYQVHILSLSLSLTLCLSYFLSLSLSHSLTPSLLSSQTGNSSPCTHSHIDLEPLLSHLLIQWLLSLAHSLTILAQLHSSLAYS